MLPESPQIGRTIYLTDKRGCQVAFTIIPDRPGRVGLVGPSRVPLSLAAESFEALVLTQGASWTNVPDFRNDHHASAS